VCAQASDELRALTASLAEGSEVEQESGTEVRAGFPRGDIHLLDAPGNNGVLGKMASQERQTPRERVFGSTPLQLRPEGPNQEVSPLGPSWVYAGEISGEVNLSGTRMWRPGYSIQAVSGPRTRVLYAATPSSLRCARVLEERIAGGRQTRLEG